MTSDIKFMLILLFLLIAVFIASLITLLQIKGEYFECIDNPLIYGAKKAKEDNKANFYCTCSLQKGEGVVIQFSSESDELLPAYSNSNDTSESINISNILDNVNIKPIK